MRHKMEGLVWTDNRIEQLKQLWADGLSCSQIARALNCDVTRNAVIGKVTRLNLVKRAAPAPRTWSYKRNPQRIEAPYVPPPVVENPPLVLADGSRVTVMTVSDRHCRWPIGDPGDQDFHFCGNAPERGPYCEAHARKAYQPQQSRRTVAAKAYRDSGIARTGLG